MVLLIRSRLDADLGRRMDDLAGECLSPDLRDEARTWGSSASNSARGRFPVFLVSRAGPDTVSRPRMTTAADSLPVRDEIQHMMHAVDQVDIPCAARPIHDLGPRCPAFAGVAGEVTLAVVRLDLDNPGGERSVPRVRTSVSPSSQRASATVCRDCSSEVQSRARWKRKWTILWKLSQKNDSRPSFCCY